MRSLSPQAILAVWERCQGRHALDQALVMLSVAFPHAAQEDLAALSIGRRDAYLLDVYEQTFAPQLDGVVDCPLCHERLEFSFAVAQLRVAPVGHADGEAIELHVEGFALRLRLPNSFDLARIVESAARLPDIAAARRFLASCCVVAATTENGHIAAADLPEHVITALSEALAERDPQAELLFNLTCPACGYVWQSLFDIVTFLWARIQACAIALLKEVDTLARAYGWAEDDILSMSATRRQAYLDMLS